MIWKTLYSSFHFHLLSSPVFTSFSKVSSHKTLAMNGFAWIYCCSGSLEELCLVCSLWMGGQGREDHRQTCFLFCEALRGRRRDGMLRKGGPQRPQTPNTLSLLWHWASQTLSGVSSLGLLSTLKHLYGRLCSYRLKNRIGFKATARLAGVKRNKGLVLTRLADVCKEPECEQVLLGRIFAFLSMGSYPFPPVTQGKDLSLFNHIHT